MKKMLIVNDTVTGGGVEKLIHDMIMHWYKDYEITVLSYKKEKNFHSIYPAEVKNISYGCKGSLKNIKGLRRYDERFKDFCTRRKLAKINKGRYDILLSMKEGPIMKFAMDIKADVKLAWVHLDYKNAYWTHSVFLNAENEINCMKKYKNIICVSNYISETIKSRIGDPDNLLVRYNPINEREVIKKAYEEAVDIAAKSDKMRFISVGRLHYQKGYDMLLNACKKLNDEGYEYELYIVGEGEQEQILKKQSADEIDAVSGATCSSRAIAEAVKQALEQARK